MTTSATSEDLLSAFPDTNLIIWLDPIKNDLFVSVITNTQEGVPNRMETIDPIENVPIKKVFRVTVVFTQQFLEVYINGNLEKSMPFQGAPIQTSAEANFYPAVSAVGPNVRLANIAFWPRTLTAREVRAYGAPMATENFFFKVTAK
jgi:hypothetical protein